MNNRLVRIFASFSVLALLLALMPAQFSVNAAASELFFSEYIEGSSFNKAVEIYNGTGSSVDLSTYTVELYSNGAATPSQSVALSGTLADGDVFVMAHSSADAAILAETDLESSAVINFNGDDAVVLRNNGTVVDAFGQIGVDPGSEWTGGGTNDTLRRDENVCAGDTNPDDPFDASVEWVTFAVDTFDGLGTHTANCDVVADTAPSVTSTTPSDGATGVAIDASIEINFSENVTVSSGWFDISCTSSGAHTASESGGPTTFTLDPDSDFDNSETCTVTVFSAQVTDQDTDDPPDTMDADYAFSFTTADVAGEAPNIIITEIMYDPDSTEPDWEWIEIYNAGSSSVDLTGFVVDDNNSNSHNAANIAGGTLATGEQAVLYNGNISAADFQAAWGTVNLIPVTDWTSTAMGLNNGGDKVSLWDSFASYSGDNVAHANAFDTVDYAGAGFPDPVGASIYLTDLGADNNVSSNWATSTDGGVTPLFTGYTSVAAGGNVGGEIGSPGTPGATEVQLLLLSELVVTPTGGEFIEIYNPNSSAVDLSDVYLTDATFAGGGTYYYNIVTGTNSGGGSFGDFHARFPGGASIGPDEYQTIALAGSDDFFAEYGVNPTYELFEDGSSADSIPDMREAFTGSINNQGGLTNDGEVVVLYQWDGASDLVTDLDYALWGDKAEAVDKTGVSIDGPDADTDASSYLNDTAIASQDVIATGAHAIGESWQRDDLTEGAEVKTGGNGAAGHDETSEDLSNTWCTNTPTPNAASDCDTGGGLEFGICFDDTETPIHAVQGSGLASPLDGMPVNIEGVVVATFQGPNQIGGYHVQEEDADADADPLTSEGLYIFDNSNSPTVGDIVRVQGTVAEFSDLTELNNISNFANCGSGGVATPASVTLPVSSIDDFEKYEGMAVTLPQTLYISEYFNFDRFGEIVLSTDRQFQPTAIYDPGSTDAANLASENELSRITLDDGRSNQNPDPAIHPNGSVFDLSNLFRGGDTVQNVTGVMDYAFGLYRIQPTQGANYSSENPRTAQPDDVGGNLKVASFNVLNYFTTLDDGVNDICGPAGDQECRGADDANEFTRQRDKIIAAIAAIDADVVGLIEIENHPADVPTADLVSGLNDVLGAGTYDYVATGAIGTDAIRQAFIYKPASVSLVGSYAVLDDPSFTDPLGYGEEKSRPALAQTFMDNDTGGIFTAVVNHLKSKGSECDFGANGDDDPEQGSCNLTRTLGAQALIDWLATNPTGSGDEDFLIIGDLNSYDKEDPIDALIAGGYTDMVKQYQGEYAYSYVFDGQLGYLDHALANADLIDEVTGVTVWHINADEPDLIDYDTSFKGPNQDAIYASDAYRSSDHDPVIIGLDLLPPIPQCNGLDATIYVDQEGKIVGSSLDGYPYSGTLIGSSGTDVIVATDSVDVVFGLNGDDVICTLGGDDRVYAGAGDDVVYSGDGDDLVYGSLGDDTVYGEGGKDAILGSAGQDVLDGGSGKDLVDGGSGADILAGGDQNDIVRGGIGNDGLDGGGGTDLCNGGPGSDTSVSCEINLLIP